MKDFNELLINKMYQEQSKFVDWLKNQSIDEVLNHSYEYLIRQDILLAMEDIELAENLVVALLKSTSPLSQIYNLYSKVETDHMEYIRDTIINCANNLNDKFLE